MAVTDAFARQTKYDPGNKTYTAHCAVCGHAYAQKKAWFRSLSATLQKLRLNFNFCDTCGKWICDNCWSQKAAATDFCLKAGHCAIGIADSHSLEGKIDHIRGKKIIV